MNMHHMKILSNIQSKLNHVNLVDDIKVVLNKITCKLF